MKTVFSFLLCFAVVLSALFCLGAAKGPPSEYMEGMIEPSLEVKIASQVPGILEEVSVERGDLVKKGQIVARLRSGIERANVALALAQVEFSKRKLERNRELFAKEHISAHEKDEIETEIRKGEALLQEATERLELRMIRSTVDGVVVKRELAAGEYVGDKGPIMTVAQIDPLNVEVVVPVKRFGSIVRGMTAEVRPESPVGGVYTGTVVIVDRVVDAASGTFGVRVQLPNSKLALPAGLKCTVRFHKR